LVYKHTFELANLQEETALDIERKTYCFCRTIPAVLYLLYFQDDSTSQTELLDYKTSSFFDTVMTCFPKPSFFHNKSVHT